MRGVFRREAAKRRSGSVSMRIRVIWLELQHKSNKLIFSNFIYGRLRWHTVYLVKKVTRFTGTARVVTIVRGHDLIAKSENTALPLHVYTSWVHQILYKNRSLTCYTIWRTGLPLYERSEIDNINRESILTKANTTLYLGISGCGILVPKTCADDKAICKQLQTQKNPSSSFPFVGVRGPRAHIKDLINMYSS